MIAASVWDFSLAKPVIEPLACASLNADQSARNCAATVNAAVKAAGLCPALCVQGESDGATAAKNEVALVLQEQHARACAAADAAAAVARAAAQASGAQPAPQVQPAPPPKPELVATAETCCIHAKALEERKFILEAFPLLVDALRLLWDIIKGEGGRVDFYRRIWEDECGLPPQCYQKALAQVRFKCLVSCGSCWCTPPPPLDP